MLDLDPNRPPATPRDAATLILLRDVEDAPFEVFLVRRHPKSSFMPSTYVFPGGKLDALDSNPAVLARTRGRSLEDAAQALGEPDDAVRAAALYVAAIRETFEEAGVLLADFSVNADLAAARARLASGTPFVEVLSELDAYLRLDLLVPHARWVTPAAEARRFDSRFFFARAPAGQFASHDEHETTAGAWLTPGAALAESLTGALQLPPPTLRTLENLARHPSPSGVFREAAERPPAYVDPLLLVDGEQIMLLLPGDPGHGTRVPAIAGPTRFVLEAGRWTSRDAQKSRSTVI